MPKKGKGGRAKAAKSTSLPIAMILQWTAAGVPPLIQASRMRGLPGADGGAIDAWLASAKEEEVATQTSSAPPIPPTSGAAAAAGYTRFVFISDTHGRHRDVPSPVPSGDVLVHTGDFSNTGEAEQIADFIAWLKEEGTRGGFRDVVFIAGNHDTTVHREYYVSVGQKRFHRSRKEDTRVSVDDVRAMLCACDGAATAAAAGPRITYLEDSGAIVQNFMLWGSPWQPEFCNWAFNLDRGAPCAEKWDMIPTEVDVLLTHGPPRGHGDLCLPARFPAGCVDLLRTVEERLAVEGRLKLHAFGHVHEGYGVTENEQGVRFVNASTCTLAYRPSQPPIVIDLLTPSEEDAARAGEVLGDRVGVAI